MGGSFSVTDNNPDAGRLTASPLAANPVRDDGACCTVGDVEQPVCTEDMV